MAPQNTLFHYKSFLLSLRNTLVEIFQLSMLNVYKPSEMQDALRWYYILLFSKHYRSCVEKGVCLLGTPNPRHSIHTTE